MRYAKSLCSLAVVMTAATLTTLAQSINALPAHSAPMAATSATVVPMLVRYEGLATPSNGKDTVSMTSLIFRDQTGGEPLWTETQNVSTDAAGRYDLPFGTSPNCFQVAALSLEATAKWLTELIAE